MKNLENLGQKVILFHKGGGDWISFDLLAHKDIEPLARDEAGNDIYEVDCQHVADFQKKYPDYVYIGSEDFGHTYGCNLAVFDFVAELIYKLGWQKFDVEEIK
jgi:hypothetical protein